MYALIQYMEGPNINKKFKINASQIKYKFTSTTFDSSKRYTVSSSGRLYKCRVLYLAETIDDLDNKMKEIGTSRLKMKPSVLLESATDFENSDDGESFIKNSHTLKSKSTGVGQLDIRAKRCSNVNIKLERVSDNAIIKQKEELAVTKCIDKKVPPASSQSISCELKKEHNKIHIVSDDNCSKKCSALMKAIKHENDKLRKKIEYLKKDCKKKEEELNEYRQINRDMQHRILERQNEQQVIKHQIEHDQFEINARKNYLPVGMKRNTDNTIHIGRNNYLPESIYSNIMIKSQSPSQCVGNILAAVFGEAVLLQSTASGRRSNRSKKRRLEENENVIVPLDPVKLLASQDLYSHWLSTKYSEMAGDKFSFADDLSDFHIHVARKISYLKRDQKNNNKATEEPQNISMEELIYNDDNLEIEVDMHVTEDAEKQNVEVESVYEEYDEHVDVGTDDDINIEDDEAENKDNFEIDQEEIPKVLGSSDNIKALINAVTLHTSPTEVSEKVSVELEKDPLT